MNAAEAAVERTADTCMMHSRPLAKERWTQIFLNRNTMKWRPRKAVRALHWPLGVAAMETKGILVRKTADGIEAAFARNSVDELKQGVFALSAHHKVHVF